MAGHVKYATPKLRKRLKRKVHIRLRVTGTPERPRLSVFRSTRYVYAQAIDDTTNRVLASAGELDGSLKDTGARLNDRPKVELELEVTLPDQPPHRATVVAYVSPLAIPRVQPDCSLDVRVDPNDRTQVVVDPSIAK